MDRARRAEGLGSYRPSGGRCPECQSSNFQDGEQLDKTEGTRKAVMGHRIEAVGRTRGKAMGNRVAYYSMHAHTYSLTN